MLGMSSVLAHMHDTPTHPVPKLLFVFDHLDHVNKMTSFLSFISLAVLILARVVKQRLRERPGAAWLKYIPEILLVVVGTTREFARLSLLHS